MPKLHSKAVKASFIFQFTNTYKEKFKNLLLSKLNTKRLRFSVYEHQLVLSDGRLITRKFIVLRDLGTNTIVSFTDWHLYVKGGKNRLSHNISEDGNKRHNYVVMLLNYAFFDKYHIDKLTDINIEIVTDFLNDYGRGTLPGNKSTRNESTVNKCVVAIIDFLDLLGTKNRCSFKKTDLYKEVEYKTKKGRMAKKKVPVFDVFFIENKTEILRDMPEKVFSIMMSHIRDNYPSILMLAALSAFGGLRPSESCNVRRRDSTLGAGIRFTIEDDEVTQIRIDLLKELNLRSDCIKVGGIKKERPQDIYPAFKKLFYQFYQSYMDYMDGKKYEADYGPLSVNSKGMAMTYKNYYDRFKNVVDDIIPILLASDDSEVIAYGMLLQEKGLAPHALRHWFSVKLTLFGEDVAGLKYWRGDKSPESALTYLQNKSELEKRYRKINNEVFDYRLWQAEKYFGDKGGGD